MVNIHKREDLEWVIDKTLDEQYQMLAELLLSSKVGAREKILHEQLLHVKKWLSKQKN